MAIEVTDVKVESNSKEFLKELERLIPVALEECGLAAEGYAKRLCPVDTGLLRNSITHAVSGEAPAVKTYKAQYGSNRSKKTGKRISASSKNAGSVGVGFYSGSAPQDSEGKMSVYIGTNVEYAPDVELGIRRKTAKPFLKPAVADHVQAYNRLIKSRLKGSN